MPSDHDDPIGQDWAEKRAESEVESALEDRIREEDLEQAEADAAPEDTEPRPGLFDGLVPIDGYSRAQAIDDGVLLDVTELARAEGFRIPVALTRAIWMSAAKLLGDPEGAKRALLHAAIQRVATASPEERQGAKDTLPFAFVVIASLTDVSPAVGCKIHIGPGDEAEPVITIMLSEED